MTTNSALRIIMLGPPGSGKGTQATRICERYNLGHVSTGDILRRHIQQGSELGQKAETAMAAGELLPDSLLYQMLEELYEDRDGEHVSFILDGFPRSLEQAEALEEFLQNRGQKVHQVVMLVLDDEKVVARLAGRRTCPECGRSYHLLAAPPRNEGVCDEDGTELIWRTDDHEEIIRRRLQTYHQETEPVATFYQEQGVLREVDASADMDQVEARIASGLKELM
ncbi:MAG: adenylate kinase [Vulcanimicrobiota bacterium]